MTTPDITELIEEADRLVRPFLADDAFRWRQPAGALPELDDMVACLGHLRHHDVVVVEATRMGGVWFVGEGGSSDAYEGATLPEAVLVWLLDELRQTCPVCLGWNGHDGACPVLALELDDEEERSARAEEEVA